MNATLLTCLLTLAALAAALPHATADLAAFDLSTGEDASGKAAASSAWGPEVLAQSSCIRQYPGQVPPVMIDPDCLPN